jgi:hypothetical protein
MSDQLDTGEIELSPEEKEILESFVFSAEEGFFEPIDAVASLLPPFTEIARSFRDNLDSAVVTATIPYVMARASVSRRFQAIHTGERLRALGKVKQGEDLTPELEQKALEKAHERLSEELNSKAGIRRSARNTVSELNHAFRDGNFSEAASELLRQVLVMLWGAYEAFVTDMVTSFVNQRPAVAAVLLRVRPGTLSWVAEFSEHETDGSELEEGERTTVEVFPVLLPALINARTTFLTPIVSRDVVQEAPRQPELH